MDAPRGPSMKSVSIMWAEGVTGTEARTVVSTVRDLLKVIYDVCLRAGVTLSPTAIRPFGTWVIPSIPVGNPYWGTRWYIDSAFDSGRGKVVGPHFLELVKREPWQLANPHFDVAILDRDLTADRESPPPGADDYVLASVMPGTATVISVHRLREVPDLRVRLAALRRLVVHNFGHVLEVPASTRSEDVEESGGERHCTRVCVMRHAPSVEQLLRLVEEEKAAAAPFCRECRRDLLRSILQQRMGRN